jgi:two-component system, sensor histidine kinase
MPDASTSSADVLNQVTHAHRVRAARLRIYYGATPGQFVAFIVAGFLAFMLWGVIAPVVLVSWIAAQFVLWASRTWLYLAYRRAADSSHPRWSRLATLGATVSGALWGIGGVLMYAPGSFEYQLLVLVVFVWMGISAVVALSPHLPAFFGYLLTALLPLAATFLSQGDRIHVVLGTLLAIFVVTLSFYARQNNRSLTETLKLRFENVELLAELAKQKDEAERANVGKSKFLAAASHDLRQPLHTLSLFTSMLDDEVATPKGRRVVASVNESVRALEKMFALLLDVSRLDAGVLEPQRHHFRLCDLLVTLVNDFAPEADAKGLTFECNVDAEAVVNSDPALLERILRNYIANAVRYTDRGTVRIECASLGRDWRIDVIDTGIGVPVEQHREIFQEFHQLGNPERDRNKGLGLGLAIVERVARLLDHPIGVASQPGVGSCFSVTVPRGEMREITGAAVEPAASPGDLSGLGVVVVDDEAGVRAAMQELLERWGCAVVVAGSVEEAVVALRDAGVSPGAIIADYRLRDGHDGAQAIRRLRAEFGLDVPALIATGDTAPERLREARASGHQLAHKPVSPSTLRAFLGNARRLREEQSVRERVGVGAVDPDTDAARP